MQETKGDRVFFCQKEEAKTKKHKPANTFKVKAKNLYIYKTYQRIKML